MGFLRGLLKVLLGLLTTLVIVLGLVLGGLLYMLNRQEFVFPQPALRWVASNVLEPMNIRVTFKNLDARLIRISEEDWYARRFIVRSQDLNVTMPDLLQTHVPDLDLRLGLNFHPQRYGLKEIGPIDTSGVQLNLKLAQEEPKKDEEPFDYQLWLDRLRSVKFQPIRLSFQKLVIERPGEPKMEAQLLANLQRQEGNKWIISVRADKVKGIPARSANFDLQLDLPEGPTLLPLVAQIKGRADLGKMGWAQLAGNAHLEAEDKGSVKLDLTSRFQGQRQELKATGSLNQERFALKVSGQANQPIEALRQVEVNACELSGLLRRKGKPFLQSNLDCRVGLTRVPAPDEKPFQDMLPRDFDFRIQGPISIANWDKNPIFNAPLKITLQPLLSQLYTLRGQTKVELSGRVLGGVEGITANVDVSSQLAFDRFQPVVKRLEETDFAVPAPFNTLDGRIYCNIEGRIRKMGAIMHLPLDCGTELSSVAQSMFIQARGTIEKENDQKPVIRLAIGLNKLTFELPRLAFNGSVPQIFPDKRIMTAEEQAKEAAKTDDALPVVLDLRITTPPDRPVTLVTSLQPIPVPISIDLTLKGDRIAPTGSIGVHQYRVTFFKQKAFVDHIRLVLSPEEEQPLLDGLVVFQNPDVKINLKLSGTVDRPFYELDSVPPRSPTELVSIMLYGGDAEALDDENLRNVDETRAAMVDGAIGLMSMYYLASTPIDSVGYNPYTGQFRARVRVAQGLSLSLGSDLGGVRQSVTLRKRLTENWSFETGAETDEETHESKGVAMFKWGRRY
jgi:hypothetical protein